MLVYCLLQNVVFKIVYFFFKNVFCGSVGNDLFTWLVRVGVRSCTSGSPHTPRMWEIFGSCCYCCCQFISCSLIEIDLVYLFNWISLIVDQVIEFKPSLWTTNNVLQLRLSLQNPVCLETESVAPISNRDRNMSVSIRVHAQLVSTRDHIRDQTLSVSIGDQILWSLIETKFFDL